MRYLLLILLMSLSLHAEYLIKDFDGHYRCATTYYYAADGSHWTSSVDGQDYLGDDTFIPLDGYIADGAYCRPMSSDGMGLTASESAFLMALTAVLFFTMLFEAIVTLFTRS